jgi:hypothetical protein
LCRKRPPLRQCQLWYRLAGGVLEISIGHFRLHVSEAVEVVLAVGRKELVDEFEIGMGHFVINVDGMVRGYPRDLGSSRMALST